MPTDEMIFASRLLALRKERGRGIIGRYERGEITPSIGMAQKLADAFGVTLDYLVSDKEVPNILLQDKAMLDSLVRDARTRQTYQATG